MLDQSKVAPFRMVAVNGITQLVSAVAALNEHIQKVSGTCLLRNVLVINSLEIRNAHRGECMARLIRECAPLLQKWDAILDGSDVEEKPGILSEGPREIFVNLLEVPENKRFFRLWPSAKRVLYGDGLGVNADLRDFLPDPTLSTHLRRIVSWFVPSVQVPYAMPEKEPCDYGYFLVNDPDSRVQSSTTSLLRAHQYKSLFNRLDSKMDSLALDQCVIDLPSGQECDVLLMTNLFPPPITVLDEEATGYVDLLTRDDRRRPPVIIVKPHPRHHSDLLKMVETKLYSLYQTVFIVRDHSMAVLPFEVILLRAFRSGSLKPHACNIFATSTAAYSIPVVFGLPVKIGFGERMARRIFRDPSWVSSRLRHESKLRSNVSILLQAVNSARDLQELN